MPTVLIIRGLRFFFYSEDHEPIHVHVTIGKGPVPNAKIILEPDVKVVEVNGFSKADMKKIVKLCKQAKEDFIASWKDYFDEKENEL